MAEWGGRWRFLKAFWVVDTLRSYNTSLLRSSASSQRNPVSPHMVTTCSSQWCTGSFVLTRAEALKLWLTGHFVWEGWMGLLFPHSSHLAPWCPAVGFEHHLPPPHLNAPGSFLWMWKPLTWTVSCCLDPIVPAELLSSPGSLLVLRGARLQTLSLVANKAVIFKYTYHRALSPGGQVPRLQSKVLCIKQFPSNCIDWRTNASLPPPLSQLCCRPISFDLWRNNSK